MSRAELVPPRMSSEDLWRGLETRLLELERDAWTGRRPWATRQTVLREARAIVRELHLRGTQLRLDV